MPLKRVRFYSTGPSGEGEQPRPLPSLLLAFLGTGQGATSRVLPAQAHPALSLTHEAWHLESHASGRGLSPRDLLPPVGISKRLRRPWGDCPSHVLHTMGHAGRNGGQLTLPCLPAFPETSRYQRGTCPAEACISGSASLDRNAPGSSEAAPVHYPWTCEAGEAGRWPAGRRGHVGSQK